MVRATEAAGRNRGVDVTDQPLKRQPRVAAVFGVGVSLMLVAWVLFRLQVGDSTVPFLLGLFGFAIALVAGVWYTVRFLRDYFWGNRRRRGRAP